MTSNGLPSGAAALGLLLSLSACPECGVIGTSDDLDGGGSGSSDAYTSADRASGNLDGATFPDAQAEAEGYLISDESGQPGAENGGTMPDGDPTSPCHIEGFSGNTTFIPGGTNRFTGQVVGGMCDGMVVGFEELGGFYDIPLSSNAFAIFVTLGQQVRHSSLTLVLIPRLAVTESQPAGGYCQELRVPITVVQVGTGDLQVSLSWETLTDVDLHLVEPGGNEIWYDELVSPSGGELDLDSNPNCRFDYINNENITYQGVTPPSGHYIVRVDYWEACSESGQTDFVVTVNIRGEASVYQGSFGPNDETHGEAGAGITVTQFDF